MAWIELHDTLPDHPKVIDLADLLKLDKDAVVGKLVRLWTWALNSREDGFLRAKDIVTVADVMRFKGKPQRLVEALVEVQLLDQSEGGYTIHDWDEHVAMLMEKREMKREKDRLRKQRQREKSHAGHADVTRDMDVTCHDGHAVTVPKPYHTVPNDILTDTISDMHTREDDSKLSTGCGKLSAEQVRGAWMHVLATVPSEGEVKTVLRHSVGMDISAVKFALELTCLYGATNPAAYAARTLNEWNTLGIMTGDAARAWREEASGL